MSAPLRSVRTLPYGCEDCEWVQTLLVDGAPGGTMTE